MFIQGEPTQMTEQHTTDGDSIIQTDIELSKLEKSEDEEDSVISKEIDSQTNRIY